MITSSKKINCSHFASHKQVKIGPNLAVSAQLAGDQNLALVSSSSPPALVGPASSFLEQIFRIHRWTLLPLPGELRADFRSFPRSRMEVAPYYGNISLRIAIADCCWTADWHWQAKDRYQNEVEAMFALDDMMLAAHLKSLAWAMELRASFLRSHWPQLDDLGEDLPSCSV